MKDASTVKVISTVLKVIAVDDRTVRLTVDDDSSTRYQTVNINLCVHNIINNYRFSLNLQRTTTVLQIEIITRSTRTAQTCKADLVQI